MNPGQRVDPPQETAGGMDKKKNGRLEDQKGLDGIPAFAGMTDGCYLPSASFAPKPTSIVPAMRFSHTATFGLARMRSAAKCVIEMTTTQ